MTRLAKKNHRYNRPLSEEDLVSESVVGLLEGLGRADLGHKGSVGSFCDFNILRGCGDAIRKKGNTLAQSPTDMRRKRRYLRLLYEGNDRSWRPEEVAQRMDVPLRLINKSLSNLRQTGLIYINARHGNSDTQPDDEDVDTHEELAVEDSDIEKEAVLAAEGGLGLLAILEGSGLISHHQVAMRMYYGLPPFDEEDGEPLLMRDITLALGLTDPSSMSKIKKSSLNRLKLLSGHLREYVK